MSWRSTVLILAAFVAAGIAVWFGPLLLEAPGLGEFGFIGQLGLPILVLTALELAFRRIPGASEPQAADAVEDHTPARTMPGANPASVSRTPPIVMATLNDAGPARIYNPLA
jgi:hypothetical protein